ncbi:group II intron reverse transcriptase/maturase [bacterium]|nr:group II intron reverse transcriptase/maturase [bacterium]
MGNPQRLPTMSPKLVRIAEKAKREPNTVFTSLAHLMGTEHLKEAWVRIRKDGATGVDGMTAGVYGEKLEENIQALHERLRKGSYRAPPVRRAKIPKEDGSFRELGIPTLEDKIVQKAVAMILEAIYEQDFRECSYGFRPGRSAHEALEALRKAILFGKVNWVLDADISRFFDEMDHRKLMEIVRRRVKDGRIVRLIGKWLKAGVMTEAGIQPRERGTPQGGVISPILANIFLHHVLDEWMEDVVYGRMSGECRYIRYADDFLILFQKEDDARRVLAVLPKRLGKFGLRLNEGKTKLIRFGRFAKEQESRQNRKPETFDFLGFTHYCGESRHGKFQVMRQTQRKRFQKAVTRVVEWVKSNRCLPRKEQHHHLCMVLRGHYQYYGVTGNLRRIKGSFYRVTRAWCQWLRQRSQRHTLSWERFAEYLKRYPLPIPCLPKSYVHAVANP